jgi:hypothetical protein
MQKTIVKGNEGPAIKAARMKEIVSNYAGSYASGRRHL